MLVVVFGAYLLVYALVGAVMVAAGAVVLAGLGAAFTTRLRRPGVPAERVVEPGDDGLGILDPHAGA
jgi:hypothetical protein